eukprot:scaffold28434_cov26-Tisochrysis_lutea.AAC.3
MHEQVVGLIIKAPLAHHQACAGVLAPLHHVPEVLLLLRPQLLILLHTVDVNLQGHACTQGVWSVLRARMMHRAGRAMQGSQGELCCLVMSTSMEKGCAS